MLLSAPDSEPSVLRLLSQVWLLSAAMALAMSKQSCGRHLKRKHGSLLSLLERAVMAKSWSFQQGFRSRAGCCKIDTLLGSNRRKASQAHVDPAAVGRAAVRYRQGMTYVGV